jgi:hypothetical protein
MVSTPVDHGAIDDPVDLVQPVAQDRDAGGDRNGGDNGQGEQQPQGPLLACRWLDHDEDGDCDRAGEQEPLELLALDPPGPAEPKSQGAQAGQPAQHHEPERREHNDRLDLPERLIGARVDQGGAAQWPQRGCGEGGDERDREG